MRFKENQKGFCQGTATIKAFFILPCWVGPVTKRGKFNGYHFPNYRSFYLSSSPIRIAFLRSMHRIGTTEGSIKSYWPGHDGVNCDGIDDMIVQNLRNPNPLNKSTRDSHEWVCEASRWGCILKFQGVQNVHSPLQWVGLKFYSNKKPRVSTTIRLTTKLIFQWMNSTH